MVVRTAGEALRRAASYFMGGGLTVAHSQSVSYVETTVGEARQLFEPNKPRSAPEAPDDAPAWVFVAYGQFEPWAWQTASRFAPTPITPATASAAYVVVPKGGERLLFGWSDEQYDLSQLGTPVDVASLVLQQLCDEMVEPSARAQLC